LLALLTGWAFRPPQRAWRLAGLSAAALVWCWTVFYELPVTKLTILPVNGGTTIYCDSFGSKRDLLIDTGSTNSVQFITKPFLRAQGVNQLPRLILTHGDLHHIGGVEPILQTFEIPRVWTSPLRFRSTAYRRTIQRLAKIPNLLGTLNRDDHIGDWTVLHPETNDRFARADDGAIVLKAASHGTRILLLSDLGRAGQKALLERTADLRADIVVAGLPASDEPLCDALLNAIHPRLIVISDSEFPISERASAPLHARLEHCKIPVIYTRAVGAVTLELRKQQWELRTMSGLELNSSEPGSKESTERLPRELRH